MKYFIVIVVFAIVAGINAVTDEQKSKAGEHVKACAVEAGVTEDQLKAIKETSKVDIKDPKLQKFAKCFFTKAGFTDSNGEFNEKVTIEKLSAGETDKKKVEQLVKLCKNEIGNNKDENPIKLYQCYIEQKAL